MMQDTISPWNFYQGWDVYQGHLVKAIEHLTAEQLEAVQQGQPLRFTAPETNSDFVVLTADDYERLRAQPPGKTSTREG